MNFHKTALSGIKWTTIGTLGNALFQLIQVAILTRYLPKEAFGIIAMAVFVVQFSNIFVDMGMTSAILHRQNATMNEYSSIYWLNIIVSLFLYILLYILTPLISWFYNEAELHKLVPILGINLLLIAAGRQHRTILQKQFKFKTIAFTELFSYFLGLISAILLAINNYGVYSLVYSTLLSSLISNSLFLTLNLRQNPVRFHLRLKDTLPFIKIGGFTMGSTFLDFFSREIDILIIGKMLGAENLGIYSLAKQIVLKLYAIVNPIITNVLNPLLSSIQKEKEKIRQYYLKIVSLLAIINFPIYLLIVVLSKEILFLFYGPEYITGFRILSFFAISYSVNTISNPVGSLQIATGRTDIGFKWTIIRVLVTSLFILIASFFSIDITAAAIALLSVFLIIPMWWLQLKPMGNIKLKEYLLQFYKPFLIFLLIASIYLVFVNSFDLHFNLLINSAIKGSLCTLVFFGLLWITDKQNVTELRNLIFSIFKSEKSI